MPSESARSQTSSKGFVNFVASKASPPPLAERWDPWGFLLFIYRSDDCCRAAGPCPERCWLLPGPSGAPVPSALGNMR